MGQVRRTGRYAATSARARQRRRWAFFSNLLRFDRRAEELGQNSIVDPHMILLLYEASQAGVKVDLFVRGMCCLRPGVKGVSENIRVVCVVGRYLEHSRIFFIRNNGNEEIYLVSADLMERNLDNRVEVVFPVERPEHVYQFRENVLAAYMRDTMRARIMNPDGTYTRSKPKEKEEKFDIQEWLMNPLSRGKG